MYEKAQKSVSIVVPVFNEELNIEPFLHELDAKVAAANLELEVIFVDDGSSDASFEILRGLASQDKRIHCIRLSRNFGSIAAYTAGLAHTQGEAAIVISCDLQDPPGIIPELISKWEKGAHVVWAVRASRDDPWLKRTLARAFAHVFRSIGFKDYPLTGMDFGLFDRKVINAYLAMPERSRIFVAMILWLGFRQEFVSYHREARRAGRSKWGFGRRLKSAVDAIVSYSLLPIWVLSYFGIVVSALSFLYATFLVVGRVFFGIGDVGWASLMTATLFIGGVQLVMLGVLGEYVARAAEQGRQRPNFVVMETLGFDAADSSSGSMRPPKVD